MLTDNTAPRLSLDKHYGANGARSRGDLENEKTREFAHWRQLTKNIEMIMLKDQGASMQAPVESGKPNCIYVVLNKFVKPGNPIKEITRFGRDCLRVWTIHFQPHHGLVPHVHYCEGKNRIDEDKAYPLTRRLSDLVRMVTEQEATKALCDAPTAAAMSELRASLPHPPRGGNKAKEGADVEDKNRG